MMAFARRVTKGNHTVWQRNYICNHDFLSKIMSLSRSISVVSARKLTLSNAICYRLFFCRYSISVVPPRQQCLRRSLYSFTLRIDKMAADLLFSEVLCCPSCATAEKFYPGFQRLLNGTNGWVRSPPGQDDYVKRTVRVRMKRLSFLFFVFSFYL